MSATSKLANVFGALIENETPISSKPTGCCFVSQEYLERASILDF